MQASSKSSLFRKSRRNSRRRRRSGCRNRSGRPGGNSKRPRHNGSNQSGDRECTGDARLYQYPVSARRTDRKSHHQQGNIVSPNTELTTINQVEPIYVTFSIPQNQLPSVKKGQTVTVSPQDSSSSPENGNLFFIDNAVDPATGTIRVKASFPNRNHKLWPGQFVRVVLRLGTKPGALIVPGQAVQTGQDGSFVFVVKPDQTVESRPVVPGMHVDGQVVIEKGLELGETVVTEGQIRLAAGSRVRIR